MENKYIVDYITEKEVRCNCRKCAADPSRYPISFNQEQLEHYQKLSIARHVRGVPLIFVSSFRCPDHPLSIINPTSTHCTWMANDVYEKGIPIYETYRYYNRAAGWNGMGYNEYGGTIHLDSNPRRYGRWKYKKSMRGGKYIYTPDYMILCKI